jgi:hypothetical protein
MPTNYPAALDSQSGGSPLGFAAAVDNLSTVTTSTTSSGASSIAADTTGWPSKGYLVPVGSDDVVSYSGTTGAAFTGCSGISAAIPSGTVLRQVPVAANHNDLALALVAVESKLGIGASTPAGKQFLWSGASGESEWTNALFADSTGLAGDRLNIGDDTFGDGETTVLQVTARNDRDNYVMADFVYETEADGAGPDVGAFRAVASQMTAGDSHMRAGEFHVRRTIGDGDKATWGLEIGVHSGIAGDDASRNVGIYLSSHHDGWTPSGSRAGAALLIEGEDGWEYSILAHDTDNVTALFYVDQNGLMVVRNVILAGASAGSNAGQPIYSFESDQDTGLYWPGADQLGFVTGGTERFRLNGAHLVLHEAAADPSAATLTSGANAKDRLGLYMKNDKLVFAYNNAGTVTYLSIPLNGSSTTWTHSTAAP